MSETIHMHLTTKGQALNAKIQAGDGTVPLEITRVVTASGRCDDPLNLDDVVDMRQTATITDRRTFGIRAAVTIILTNQGNPIMGEPPLLEGYSLTQFGMFAIDPDEGEILYRISQFERPNYVPAATEMGWTINPTWNFVTENASEVIVNVDPNGLATLQRIWDAIELSDRDIPLLGTRAHLQIVDELTNYWPPGVERPGTEFPDDDISGMEGFVSVTEKVHQEQISHIDGDNVEGVE